MINEKNDAFYMKRAIELAEYAASMGEVPVGAVIVHKPTGNIIGEGFNTRERDKSPLAHAELAALDAACKRLGGWRIPDSEMFVTLEPCPMCAGALIHARIDRLIFGAYDKKSGSVCSVQKMFAFPYNHKPDVAEGFMEEECSELLRKFFRELRQRKKEEGLRWRKEMSKANERAAETDLNI
ncbi:MAG: tRNA adenosine(34) deaminase TadA [Oscillospiraceae bacterium]|nr:tRNA adenosine(34) deaminase TadA [Oscillospiraceae bacterium]